MQCTFYRAFWYQRIWFAMRRHIYTTRPQYLPDRDPLKFERCRLHCSRDLAAWCGMYRSGADDWSSDAVAYDGVTDVIPGCGGSRSGRSWHETLQQSDECRSTGKYQRSTDSALHAGTGLHYCKHHHHHIIIKFFVKSWQTQLENNQ